MNPPKNSRIRKFSPPRVWPSNNYNIVSSNHIDSPATTRKDLYGVSKAALKTAYLQAKIDAEKNK